MTTEKLIDSLGLRKGHKWFSALSRESEEWDGPWNNIQSALLGAIAYGGDSWDVDMLLTIFVTQGRKLTKAEKDEMGVEYDWECNGDEAMEIRLP